MPDIENDDFFDPSIDTSGGHDISQRIKETFNATIEAEQKATELNALLDGYNSIISKNKSDVLPSLLQEFGSEIWRDPDTGLTVELETAVNSSLPKDQNKRNAILDALRPLGIEQIMAEEFNIIFAPGDKRVHAIRAILGLEPQDAVIEGQEDAPRLTNHQMDLIHQLRESLELENLPAEEKLGVHPSRLKSWLKRQIDGGNGPAVSEAGIWHGKHAKIIKPKEAKRK